MVFIQYIYLLTITPEAKPRTIAVVDGRGGVATSIRPTPLSMCWLLPVPIEVRPVDASAITEYDSAGFFVGNISEGVTDTMLDARRERPGSSACISLK